VSAIDPVTLAVLAGRMEQIADEMDATLFRSAFNPIIAEAHDASHGLYDPLSGATLVQGKSGLPIFVGVMAFAVKSVIDKAAISVTAGCSAIWRRWAIGMMSAAMCRAITTRSRPKPFRRRWSSRRSR
jgi:N-methylhydantoinase B